MTEATLSKDSYGRNSILKDDEAMIRQIYYLCMMKKGTDPLNPDKGCDVMSYRYSYKDDSVIMALQQEINQQIMDYTPYKVANVICKAVKNKAGNYILHIFISLNKLNSIIDIATNGERSKMSVIQI